MPDYNRKYYLSTKRFVDDTAVLLNESIAGKDKGGLTLSEFSKDVKINNNRFEGTGQINSGKFTIKSVNMNNVFLRYGDFLQFVNVDVYLIVVLENGKTAYRQAKLNKANISELKRSDSLDTSFSLEFVSEYSGWRTEYYKGIEYQKLFGKIIVELTEAQNTQLQNLIRNNQMFFRIYRNQVREVLVRFEFKQKQVLATDQASFLVDLESYDGSYFDGASASKSMKGNFNADSVSDTIIPITELFFEIGDKGRNNIITNINVISSVECLIYDDEILTGGL